MPRMKNVNIFVDVDLTLVDETGRILPGAAAGLARLREAGCHLFLWSTGGAQHCRDVAERYALADLFEGFLPKPDIYIDDMPSSFMNSLLFDVHERGSWEAVTREIVHDHVAR